MKFLTMILVLGVFVGCKKEGNQSQTLKEGRRTPAQQMVEYRCDNGGVISINKTTRDQAAGYNSFPRPDGPHRYQFRLNDESVTAVSEWKYRNRRMHLSLRGRNTIFQGFMTSKEKWIGYAQAGEAWQDKTCVGQEQERRVQYSCPGLVPLYVDTAVRDRVAGYNGYPQPDGPQEYTLTDGNGGTYRATSEWRHTSSKNSLMGIHASTANSHFIGFMSAPGVWKGFIKSSNAGGWQPLSCAAS